MQKRGKHGEIIILFNGVEREYNENRLDVNSELKKNQTKRINCNFQEDGFSRSPCLAIIPGPVVHL